MKVYGMGERKTPQPFIAACDKFIYIEVIRRRRGGGEPGEGQRRQAACPRL